MKKIMIMVLMAIVACTAVDAQSALDLAKQKKAQNKEYMGLVNAKPSKAAKKRAKELMKEGWRPVGSGASIEHQISNDQLLAEELMADENGNPMFRYLQHSATAVAGTQTAAFAAARTACLMEIQSLIETRIAAAMEQKLDNAQSSAINAITVDKFHQRAKAIIDGVFTDGLSGLNIYRVLPNNNYEVQVTISYDKQQVSSRLKMLLQRQLEMEGDAELNGIVDQILADIH